MTIMSYCLKLLLVFLFCLKQEAELAIAARKFVYQKDMSEYCRRRVMPSVFLGRQVIDAYSQILHFSRLELPYSCSVSIRTESGSNIILVIQLMSDKSLIESCRDSRNQLLVYEIGETFGGYWGALPDNMMKSEAPKDDNHYTLKTTQPTVTTTEESTTTRKARPSTTRQSEDVLKKPVDRQDYITLEVPIVNVSAKLVPGNLPSNTIFDPEDSFDLMFDVTPWPGMSYETKVLPLVQFSIQNEVSARRTGEELEISPRYKVDLNADAFTPDSRLTFPLLGPTATRKQFGKFRYNVNRRLNFEKNKQLFAQKQQLAEKEDLFYRNFPTQRHLYSSLLNNLFTRPYDFIQPQSQKETERDSNSWDVVDAILKNLSKTKDDDTNMKVDKNVANLLHGLAKIGHNDSVFLAPNSSWYTRRPSSISLPVSIKYRTDSITWRQPSVIYRTNYLEEVEDTSKAGGLSQVASKPYDSFKAKNNNDFVINNDGSRVPLVPLLPLALDIDGVIFNVTSQKNNENNIKTNIIHPGMLVREVSGTTTTATTLNISTNIINRVMASEISGSSTTATPKIDEPMTLVDHESWENMVHAASLMAVMLNQSATPSVDDQKQGMEAKFSTTVSSRKKRYIHAIPIDHAKPHRLPVKIEVPSSTVHTDKISDAQEFQRLIELQDDEIHDRVALRYLRQYVGPALFNICDFDEAASRNVYLFNSSRLVLAITNFTLERMTVVMTPARTLLTSSARCAAAHLECQVSGARVCIDSLSACDGVPNCGSYDIYDEDRLTCGSSAGLQHNVCLAAVTFLAVLLTILYTVHYWLKRCVPKVSDAFFIYTDAAENVLYLDSIMRSPYDTDDDKYFFRGGTIQDYMECTDMRIKTKTVGSYIGRFFRFFGCKRKKRMPRVSHEETIEEEFDHMNPDVYSLGEIELSKIESAFVSDAAVQTGSSLEIKVLGTIKLNERLTEFDSVSDDIVTHYEGKRRSTDNRSLLNLETSSNQPSDELSILKFFRKARSVSMQISSAADETIPKHIPHSEEKEIQCLEYDRDGDHKGDAAPESVLTTTAEISDKKPEQGLVQKRLRFEEETKIMWTEDDEDASEEVLTERPRRSVVYGVGKKLPGDTDSNTDADTPSGTTNREFKSYFWGGGKSKTKKSSKKKAQVSLR